MPRIKIIRQKEAPGGMSAGLEHKVVEKTATVVTAPQHGSVSVADNAALVANWTNGDGEA